MCAGVGLILVFYPFDTTYFIYQIRHFTIIYRKVVHLIQSQAIETDIGGRNSYLVVGSLEELTVLVDDVFQLGRILLIVVYGPYVCFDVATTAGIIYGAGGVE